MNFYAVDGVGVENYECGLAKKSRVKLETSEDKVALGEMLNIYMVKTYFAAEKTDYPWLAVVVVATTECCKKSQIKVILDYRTSCNFQNHNINCCEIIVLRCL